MTQLSLFPPPPGPVPTPGKEIVKPFSSWREATDYAQSLSLDLWDVRLWFDAHSIYYVKAVEK